MSEPTELGFQLETGISLSVDWKVLSDALIQTAINGLSAIAGDVSSIASAFSTLYQGVGSIKRDDTPGQKIWQLFWLSMSWSLDELRSIENINEEELENALHKTVNKAQEKVCESDLFVPMSFFNRPVTLPLYQIIRDEIVLSKKFFRPSPAESRSELSARFDAAFSRAVSAIWINNPQHFESLLSSLSIPAADANSFELQWDRYRHILIHDFEVSPLFGQQREKITLAQAYIPLRCKWRKRPDDINSGEHFAEQLNQFAMLDSLIDKWLMESTRDKDKAIKLIGGGPGSGKSTTVKRLARVMADRADIRPLYIPLQHISLDGSLRDAINSYFTGRTNGAFTQSPLSREAVEDGPKLLLIFDGLDEIARPGEAADEVANLFISKLDQLLSALQGNSTKLPKVIVTGRLPSFQAARKFRGALEEDALEVVGYAPIPRREIDAESTPEDDPVWELLDRDQRLEWWGKYAPLARLKPEVPGALTDRRLADVTNEPLLCYLLVLSGFAVDNWEAAAENKNLIYKKLIDEVWRRGWGDRDKKSDRQGPGKNVSKKSFNELMETIALAAWLGGDTRVASEASFHQTLKITQAEESWHEFQSDGGQDVANLAMNFYLKSSDGNERGFEFTHKSFGDYLAARAILSVAKEVGELVPRHTDPAMQAWLRATCTGTLSPEILFYLRDEVRLDHEAANGRNSDPTKTLFKKFEQMARTALDEGLPAHAVSTSNWRVAARYQKNAEVMLWAVLNACVLCLQEKDEHRLIEVGFEENPILLKHFLARVFTGDENGTVGNCLAFVKADGSDLFGLELSHTCFAGSSLNLVNFAGCHLMSAMLTECGLQKATFERANLDACMFRGSDVSDADFVDSRNLGRDILDETVGNITISPRTLLDWRPHGAVPLERLKLRSSAEGGDDNWEARAKFSVDLKNAVVEGKTEFHASGGDS